MGTDGGFDKPWCSTATDIFGNHVKGNWGDCSPACLSQQSSTTPSTSSTCSTVNGPLLAASVSSLSSTMARFTLPAPMQGGSPSHGAPPGWTTGAGTMKSTGATVIQTLARWRESGAELGHQASVTGYLSIIGNKDWQN